MSLKDKVKGFKREGIAFMEGREKGKLKDLFDKEITIRNYDFIKGEDGEYVVFIIDEDENNFYFGGAVLTSNFKEFDGNDKAEILENGLPLILRNKKGKKHNYTSVEYLVDQMGELEKNDLPF